MATSGLALQNSYIGFSSIHMRTPYIYWTSSPTEPTPSRRRFPSVITYSMHALEAIPFSSILCVALSNWRKAPLPNAEDNTTFFVECIGSTFERISTVAIDSTAYIRMVRSWAIGDSLGGSAAYSGISHMSVQYSCWTDRKKPHTENF